MDRKVIENLDGRWLEAFKRIPQIILERQRKPPVKDEKPKDLNRNRN